MSFHKSPFLYFQIYTTAITVISPKQIPCEDIIGTRIKLLQNMIHLLTSIFLHFGRAARTCLFRLIRTQNMGRCPPPPAPPIAASLLLFSENLRPVWKKFHESVTAILSSTILLQMALPTVLNYKIIFICLKPSPVRITYVSSKWSICYVTRQKQMLINFEKLTLFYTRD